MPHPCPNLRFGHRAQLALLHELAKLPGIKKVFIASGIRPDLVMADKEWGGKYVKQLARCHVSGQIKLAPEHADPEVLRLMNKPSPDDLLRFKALFDAACRAAGERRFMTYYLVAAHPGCTMKHMEHLKSFLASGLKTTPEQVQIFTPTPATLSTTMYYCGTDLLGKKISCEKDPQEMQKQKDLITPKREMVRVPRRKG